MFLSGPSPMNPSPELAVKLVLYSVMVPLIVIEAIFPLRCSLNQIFPSGPMVIPEGPEPLEMPVLYSVIVP